MDLLPKDQEVEINIFLTKGDIDDILNDYPDNYEMIWDDIKDQIIGKFSGGRE